MKPKENGKQAQGKMNAKKETQLNIRVAEPLKRGVKLVAASTDFTQEEIISVALRATFGSRDGLVREMIKKIQEAAHKLSLSESFNGPELPVAGFAE